MRPVRLTPAGSADVRSPGVGGHNPRILLLASPPPRFAVRGRASSRGLSPGLRRRGPLHDPAVVRTELMFRSRTGSRAGTAGWYRGLAYRWCTRRRGGAGSLVHRSLSARLPLTRRLARARRPGSSPPTVLVALSDPVRSRRCARQASGSPSTLLEAAPSCGLFSRLPEALLAAGSGCPRGGPAGPSASPPSASCPVIVGACGLTAAPGRSSAYPNIVGFKGKYSGG